jgi:hypothetical protein
MSDTVPPSESILGSSTQVDVRSVDIDHVTVTNPIRSTSAQTWIALTPVLSVLIAAASLVITFGFQVVQTRTASLDKQDSEWRSALEHLTMDEKGAATGVLEMQSFLDNPRYGEEASSISTALLPVIPDKYQFDAAYFTLLKRERHGRHKELVSIDRLLSNELRNRWEFATSHDPGQTLADMSLQNFVIHPASFYNEQTQALDIEQTNSVIWKLDSTASGLSSIWQGQILSKDEDDLTGLIFVNNDFRNVDFSKSDLHDAVFLGKCQVKPGWNPEGVEIDCMPSK